MLPLTERLDYAILSVVDDFYDIPLERSLLTSIVEDYGFKKEDIEKRINLMLANERLRMIQDGRIVMPDTQH